MLNKKEDFTFEDFMKIIGVALMGALIVVDIVVIVKIVEAFNRVFLGGQ